MYTKDKLTLENAIKKAIDKISEESDYPGWFHMGLVESMTDSAEAVFDASMDAQEFCRENDVS